jgi:hypothetical protein
MGSKTVSDAAQDVLRRATVLEDRVVLPNERLDRKLYSEVNDVLVSLGGKWVGRKIMAHVFAGDPREALATVLDTGVRPIEDKNPYDYFPTPAPIVAGMMDQLGFLPDDAHILEPSAGEGAIVSALLTEYPSAHISAVELDPARAATTSQLSPSRLTVTCGDYLQWEFPRVFNAVAMNPPFTAPGDPLAYIAHIERAYGMLAPFGRLVAIAPSGLEFRTDRRTTAFRALVESVGRIESLPPSAFRESGTDVNTTLVFMERAA